MKSKTSIIVLVIVVLGIIAWFTYQRSADPARAIMVAPDPVANELKQTSKSDEVAAIETDLDASDLSDLGAGLEAIDASSTN